MRADDSPATRRMLRIMEQGPAPARAGQPWPATAAAPGSGERRADEFPAEPSGGEPPPRSGSQYGDVGAVPGGGLPGPLLAIDRRTAIAAGSVVLLGLLVCAWMILRPGPPVQQVPQRAVMAEGVVPGLGATGAAVPATPPPLAAGPPMAAATSGGALQGEAISVYVVGAVRHPGVVRLASGSRVVDAMDAAGGATSRADLTAVNLARKITDGEQILVPRPGQVVAAAAEGSSTGGSSGSSGSSGGAGTSAGAGTPAALNLNTATEAQFDELPGVGPVIAGRIVAWRQQNGQYSSVDQLAEIEGIGDVTLQKLRPMVTV